MRSDLVKALTISAAGAIFGAGILLVPAVAQDMLPPGPGMEETMKGCGGCHGIGQVMAERRSAQEWADTVAAMISHGAPVEDSEFDLVVGYLATHFGDAPPAPAEGVAPAAPVEAVVPAPAEGVAPVEAGVPAAPVEGAAAPTGTMPPAGGTAPATPPVGNIPAQ